jgi:hypothetical protein
VEGSGEHGNGQKFLKTQRQRHVTCTAAVSVCKVVKQVNNVRTLFCCMYLNKQASKQINNLKVCFGIT